MNRFCSPLCAWMALLALCGQLWLAAAHAYGGVAPAQADPAAFCGDGNPPGVQALRAQLAPELQAGAGADHDCCDGACPVCAPPCSPALPFAPVVSVAVLRPGSPTPPVVAGERHVRPRRQRPPATGPPTMT